MGRARKAFEYAIDIFFIIVIVILAILLLMAGFDALSKVLHHL